MIYLIIVNHAGTSALGCTDFHAMFTDRWMAYEAFGHLPMCDNDFAQLVSIDPIVGTWEARLNAYGREAASNAAAKLLGRADESD
jgi:hypothetical protein